MVRPLPLTPTVSARHRARLKRCEAIRPSGHKNRTMKTDKKLVVKVGMFRAIFTKYLGPTDRRGSRIKAYDCEGFSVTVNINHSFSDGRNHAEAAQKLCEKMEWAGTLVSGGTKEGQVFVFIDSEALRPEQVLITCANREDAEWTHKTIQQQIGKEEQTLGGRAAGILRAAIQRAASVEIGGVNAS